MASTYWTVRASPVFATAPVPVIRSALSSCVGGEPGGTTTVGALPAVPAGDRSAAGMAPIAGLDGGGFMSDLVLVPYADAMLIPFPDAVDPISIASLSDNIPDGWRTVGPFNEELAKLDPVDRRVLVVGRLSIGLYSAAFAAALGAHVDYVDTDPQRLAAAEKLGAVVHDIAKPDKSWEPYPVTVHTTGDSALLSATLRATWPDGVCTDTGIYPEYKVEMPLLPMYTRGVQFITGRVSARTVIPRVLELLADGLDIAQIMMLGQKPMSAGFVFASLQRTNLDFSQRGGKVGCAGLRLF